MNKLTPKVVEIVELKDGTWRSFLDFEKISEQLEVENVYLLEINWRLLENA